MKTSLSLIRCATIFAAVAVGMSALGQSTATATTTTPTTKKKRHEVIAAAAATTGTPSSASKNAVGLLDHAYGLLASADHDYDGHRVRAMHKIEEAARALGSKLSGGGKGDEKQGTSDSQLHNAQSLLQQAVGEIKGKAHHHVEEAINQLNIALKVK